MIGVYWGAFDPFTKAHAAVIDTVLKNMDLEKLIVVVNNHSYKKYTASLEKRKKVVESYLKKVSFNVEVLSQDDKSPLDYHALLQREKPPFCAVAGYDAYLSWRAHASKKEMALWERIAVIPRGDFSPALHDENAFLLEIEEEHKHTSSSSLKKEGS